jgi:hypothetical protein
MPKEIQEFKSFIYPKPNYPTSRSTRFILIGIIIIGIGGLLLIFEIPQGLYIMFPGIMILGFARWAYYKEMPEEGNIIDELDLNSEFVKIGNEKYDFESIRNFGIRFNTYYKKKLPSVWSMYKLRSGTENEIWFNYGAEKIREHFKIQGPFAQKVILEILKELYVKGISIEEYADGRTYLGEELSYEEIQEFKKKYNL